MSTLYHDQPGDLPRCGSRILPLHDADDQARVREELEQTTSKGDAEAALREANDGLDSAQLHSNNDPTEAAEELSLHRLLVLARFDVPPMQNGHNEAVKRDAEVQRLEGGQEHEGNGAQELFCGGIGEADSEERSPVLSNETAC